MWCENSYVQAVCTADGKQQGILIALQLHSFFQRHPAFRKDDKTVPLAVSSTCLWPFLTDHKGKNPVRSPEMEPVADSRLGKKKKIRCTGDALGIYNGEKGFDFSKIHMNSSLFSLVLSIGWFKL